MHWHQQGTLINYQSYEFGVRSSGHPRPFSTLPPTSESRRGRNARHARAFRDTARDFNFSQVNGRGDYLRRDNSANDETAA